MVKNLSCLRELIIDRDCHPLLCYRDAWTTIMALPTSLRKLILRFKNSFEVVDPEVVNRRLAQSHALQSDASSPAPLCWTLATAFPSLEVLEMNGYRKAWIPSDFAALPSSLTSLSLPLPHAIEMRYIEHLPRQLLHLDVACATGVDLESFAGLPPKLVSFDLRAPFGSPIYLYSGIDVKKLLGSLPRTLTHFTHPIRDLPGESLSALPPFLKALELRNSSGPMDMETMRRTPTLSTQALKMLPPIVSRIAPMDLFNEITEIDADAWPSGLTHLRTGFFRAEITILHLPPWLLHLELDSITLDASSISLLPRSLKTLQICYQHPTRTLDLPPGLTRLRLSTPPKSVQTQDDEDFLRNSVSLECLPSSLIDLEIKDMVPCSGLKYLPPRLTRLYMTVLVEDADYDPLGDEEVEKMRKNFEIGKQEGIVETFDWKVISERTSAETMLPRTLRYLSIAGRRDGVKIDFSLLPPELAYLEIGRPVPPKSIIDIQLKHLRHVRLALDLIDGEIIKNLPKWIHRLYIRADASQYPSARKHTPHTSRNNNLCRLSVQLQPQHPGDDKKQSHSRRGPHPVSKAHVNGQKGLGRAQHLSFETFRVERLKNFGVVGAGTTILLFTNNCPSFVF